MKVKAFHTDGIEAARGANDRSEVGRVGVRIAVYHDVADPPRILDIGGSDAGEVIERAAATVYSESRDLGGAPSFLAIREVIENLIHAGFAGATVSVLDEGREIIVSDHGRGIEDPKLAVRPGFSGASAAARRVVKGVGSGLAVAQENVTRSGGELVLETNVAGGTVVTLRSRRGSLRDEMRIRAEGREAPSSLNDRQRQALLVMAGEGQYGPSDIAREIGCSLATAYRDLERLERAGLVFYGGRGKRQITPEGAQEVHRILRAAGPRVGSGEDGQGSDERNDAGR